jgi:hypothetical protein
MEEFEVKILTKYKTFLNRDISRNLKAYLTPAQEANIRNLALCLSSLLTISYLLATSYLLDVHAAQI